MTPGTAESECQLVNLQLYVEPENSVEIENYECIILKQKETKQMVMKFTPKKSGRFQIKGIKFFWFGVSPVAIIFHDPLRFDTVDNYPNASLEIESTPTVSYLDLPICFNARIKLLKRSKIKSVDNSCSSLNESSESTDGTEDCDIINSLDIVADSAQAIIQLQKPLSPGFQQRWSLDPSKSNHELTFEVTPTSSGTVTVNLFISYTNICHITRFSHASLSFECKEVHKLRISQHEDLIDIQPNNDIDTVECDCAKIEYNSGSVKIIEPNYSFNGDRCSISVKRNFTGTVMNDILHINDVFLKFHKTSFVFTNFNQEIKLVFDAICLGNFDGLITLAYNFNGCFLLNGKIKYNLKGPAVKKIALSLIILKPCEIDLGEIMKVEYGKMPIKVSQIVRIE